jgi:uncharacterized integral membrane protein
MQLRTLLFVVVLSAIALFAALNWGAFMTPTTLSLAIATVQAPLGLIMLGFVAIIIALFLAFVVYLQGTVLLDSRRHAKQMQEQRELAEKAEASRLSELRAALDSGLARLGEQSAQSLERLEARLNKLDSDFGAALERTESAMAAYIGELDERLQHPGSAGATPIRPGGAA